MLQSSLHDIRSQLTNKKEAVNPDMRMSEPLSNPSTVSERVRSALSAVASGSRVNPSSNIPPLSHATVLQSLPRKNLINSERLSQKVNEEEGAQNISSFPSENQTSNTPSNVVIKKRFKHSRAVLGGAHASSEKKFKNALQQISENYESGDLPQHSTSISNAVTTVQTTLASSTLSINTIATPMQVLTHYAASNPLCPICKEKSKTVAIGENYYKCLTCCKTYMPVHRVNVTAAASFYGVQSAGAPTTMSTPANNLASRKRMANGKGLKSNKRLKTVETVDLVSSDEEEKRDSNLSHKASVAPATKNGGLAARMKLPGGAIPGRQNTPTPPPPPPSTPPPTMQPSMSPSPSGGQPAVATGEYKFLCNKAMFGELYGCTLAPTRVADNRMFLSLECIIYRNDVPVSEKYTLSVGQSDVQHFKIYFGRVPSFVAIETASRFAEVACRRIGRDVLVPGSEDPKKRYIILALISAFKNDNEAAIELGHLVSCVSPWANVQMLTLPEAAELIARANLDVNQQERCYGSQLKAAGPVETLLIYPWPPKKGGIPVTSEDLACLADGTYLNDIIIDFYLKYLYEGVLTDDQRLKTYVFNSYFYKRLTQKSSRCTPSQMHAAVKKWTRNVDIFEKDFIIIPVNEHCHWYLVVVCFPGRSLDSSTLLNEKDEEESEDESADFNKESNSISEVGSPAVNPPPPDLSSDQTKQANAEVTPTLSNPECDEEGDGGGCKVSQRDQVNVKSTNNRDTEIKDSPDAELATNTLDAEPATNPAEAEPATNPPEADPVTNTLEAEPETNPKLSNASASKKEKIVYQQAYETEEFHRPSILIFDSLVGSGHARVFTNLRHYLTEEWSSRKAKLPTRSFDKANMKGCYPKIPRQNNDCDCGVFLLQYVESFFTRQIRNFRLPIHLEEWFTLETVSRKRGEIRELITKLAEEYKESR